MTGHDPRLHAIRADLADARLKDEITAERYITGRPGRVLASVVDVRSAPGLEAGINTQLLRGDDVFIFEEAKGWCWVQAERDGYVGYVSDAAIEARDHVVTHQVVAPRSFVYPGPDLKFPRIGQISMGSTLAVTDFVETRGTRYAILPSGEAVVAGHLRPLGDFDTDYVTVAETLLHTPYLWGGASAFGIDCSGLVQLSMYMTGNNVLRDSDMQAGTIGELIDPVTDFSNLQRGDLVFWKGHVAIITDPENIIHASGHTMMVSCENLKQAVDRIGYLYGRPIAFRRP